MGWTTSTIYDTIIENQLPWTYLGVEFTTDITDTVFTLHNDNDCDSIITYSLYIHRNTITNSDSSICENYLPLIWNDVEFNSSNDTSVVLIGQYGVDSIVNSLLVSLGNLRLSCSERCFEICNLRSIIGNCLRIVANGDFKLVADPETELYISSIKVQGYTSGTDFVNDFYADHIKIYQKTA